MTFDLNVLTLNRQDGRDLPALPGTRTALPPRRAARGRGNDRLIILLAPQGDLTGSQVNRLLDGIEKTYFSTAGTATTAMRTVMEEVNQALYNHNMRHSHGGQQAIAALALVVMRGEMIYLAQAGQMHGFVVKSDAINYLYDPQSASRGLGLGRNIDISFSQSSLSHGMLLLLTPEVPSNWKENILKCTFGEQMGALRRRLLSNAGINFKAVILGIQTGTGAINVAPHNITSRDTSQTQPPSAQPTPSQETAATPSTPQRRSWQAVETPPTEAQAAPAPTVSKPSRADRARQTRTRRSRANDTPQTTQIDLSSFTRIFHKIRSVFRQAADGLGHVWNPIRTFLIRDLPIEEDFKLPASAMVTTAIAVPLLVVAVSVLIYLKVGLPKQFNTYFEQAQIYVDQAEELSKAKKKYQAYQEAIKYLDLAEQYKQTEESQALRDEVQAAIDSFDRVSRLDFSEAIAGSISTTVEIVKMIATGRDLYMLDHTSGSVLHARLIGASYEMDTDFRCGPDQYGTLIVESVVDIAPLSHSIQGENSIVALDNNGILLYCEPGETAVAVPLIPPDSNWGEPTAITVEGDNLYVLDPLTNAIWMYLGEKGDFPDAPYFFFKDKVPSLAEAIDIAIGQQQLFILNSDSHTTTCDYNNVEGAQSSCTDPATLQDDRPGHESGPIIEDARFYQIIRTQPPEPSIYYLDPIERVFYQFSMKLNLIQLYRSSEELPQGLATAFAVSPTRSVFIAIKNQVFVAFLP